MKLITGSRPICEMLKMLIAAGVGLNSLAEEYIAALDDFGACTERALDIRFCTVAELGYPDGAVLSRIYAAAGHAGYQLCPPDTGMYLRLDMDMQPESADTVLSAGKCPDGAITVSSPPITADDGLYRGLYLRNVAGKLWLRGYVCDDEYIWPGDSMFAFVFPGK